METLLKAQASQDRAQVEDSKKQAKKEADNG